MKRPSLPSNPDFETWMKCCRILANEVMPVIQDRLRQNDQLPLLPETERIIHEHLAYSCLHGMRQLASLINQGIKIDTLLAPPPTKEKE